MLQLDSKDFEALREILHQPIPHSPEFATSETKSTEGLVASMKDAGFSVMLPNLESSIPKYEGAKVLEGPAKASFGLWRRVNPGYAQLPEGRIARAKELYTFNSELGKNWDNHRAKSLFTDYMRESIRLHVNLKSISH